MRSLILIFVLFTAICCGSCSKENKCDVLSISAEKDEVNVLSQYLANNNISATRDDRGFYYTIEATGSGDHPKSCSNVTVSYVGKLTNGTEFDYDYKDKSISFDLGDLISGWQAGIPLIAKGGKITLYLPPSLAYGDKATPRVPANSILIFTIDLLKINN
jgi:FKBP-type peptidyl-prolyl cis-trans isomerase FkpA